MSVEDHGESVFLFLECRYLGSPGYIQSMVGRAEEPGLVRSRSSAKRAV